jgi:hypothetical protein
MSHTKLREFAFWTLRGSGRIAFASGSSAVILPLYERLANIILPGFDSPRGFCRVADVRSRETAENRATGYHLGTHPTVGRSGGLPTRRYGAEL